MHNLLAHPGVSHTHTTLLHCKLQIEDLGKEVFTHYTLVHIKK